MLKVLSLVILFCSLSFAKTPLQYANDVESAVTSESPDFTFTKKWADYGVNAGIYRAVQELRRKGKTDFANDLQVTWERTYRSSLFTSSRDIGDHKPAIVWLAEQYDKVELVLSAEVCRALHISDIKSLNHGIPVTIHPKDFPMDNVPGERIDEYRRHFAGGPSGNDYYYGVIPVVAYWAAFAGCQASGLAVGCGVVASLTERLIDIVAAPISDKVYNRFNGGE